MNNTIPFNTTGPATRFQTAYTAAEINMPAGTVITEIRVGGTVITTAPTFGNFRLRIGPLSGAVTVNTLSTTYATNCATLTTYLGDTGTTSPLNFQPTTLPFPGGQWYVFPLATPYIYNGTDSLVVDYSWDSRTGTGWNVATTATGGEGPRSRAYTTTATIPAADHLTATVAANGGSYRVMFVWTPPANSVALVNQSAGLVIPDAPATDRVLFDAEAWAFTTARAITSVTFNKTGTVPDGSISSVKLVADTNSNGAVDGGDSVLGTSLFAAGSVTFSAPPLITVPTASPVRLLLAISYASSLTLGDTIRVSIAGASAVTWSGGTDVSTFPLDSPTWLVDLSQLNLGTPLPATNTIPFNGTGLYYRNMTVYSAAELAEIPVGSFITEIRIHGTSVTPPVFKNFMLRLAYSNTAPAGMSSTWTNNFTGNQTTVLYAENFSPQVLPGFTTPTRWNCKLTTPFVYNGSAGLCMDMSVSSLMPESSPPMTPPMPSSVRSSAIIKVSGVSSMTRPSSILSVSPARAWRTMIEPCSLLRSYACSGCPSSSIT
jgi:hypothetical protein